MSAIRKTRSAGDEQRLIEIRGGAAHRSPTVRALAAYSEHTDCQLATLGFGAGVDFDRLLVGTRFEAPFGQSPFAIRRGIAFESLLRERNYAAVIDLLRSELGFSLADSRIVNLRDGYPPSGEGMLIRARETRSQLQKIVRGEKSAPNIIDGAVLEGSIGGVRAYFEADALATRSEAAIQVAEVKSFPKVDERVDADKLAAALDQVAIYILLAQETISYLGGDPNEFVSETALLITPKNVGLRPTISMKAVGPRIEKVGRLLKGVPSISDIAKSTAPGISFGPVADTALAENKRLDALHVLADKVGTAYKPSCLTSCGNAAFCRARAFAAASPCLLGAPATRLLPGIPNLTRAADLTRAAPPSSDDEEPVASRLAMAGRLYDELVGAAPNVVLGKNRRRHA